ncbi:hypothetical protein AN964_06090 [Heyndrickxia shackletonii]|uniref:EAL domain-containing protein n=2 Tax=Bacillaceae TaxID=186817 RepID=A0A0Q3WWS7_9BACI|nr:hypothetical protein AN964_06090 [Heyndrickxia shackletonii]
MGHSLNMNVIAEGIETKEQLLFLQEHLCDQGQGYFLSKPLVASKLKEKLDEIQFAKGANYFHLLIGYIICGLFSKWVVNFFFYLHIKLQS